MPRPFASLALVASLAAGGAQAQADPAEWDAVAEAAEGQTVYWHAWGGDPLVNDFIAWAGGRVEALHGVEVEHVKLADTADAVSRVLAEKSAGRDAGGAVDLVWINGANFASMKAAGLLFGPWAEDLPNWALVDVEDKPVRTDFTVETEGLEAPWGMAQLVMVHDAADAPEPPRTIEALAEWAEAHPGRFAYPAPPDFLGSTFLKQALHGLVEDPAVLARPEEAADFDAVTAPLWAFLDDLHPELWRSGRAWPQSGPRLRQLIADDEIDLGLSFNPNEAASGIASGELPPETRVYTLEGGTIGNASFLAIPYNASAKEGAMVLANFLLSPEAQARMQDPTVWGLGTVLDLDALPAEAAALFEAAAEAPGAVSPADLGPALPEPHPSWTTRLEAEWTRRYGAG